MEQGETSERETNFDPGPRAIFEREALSYTEGFHYTHTRRVVNREGNPFFGANSQNLKILLFLVRFFLEPGFLKYEGGFLPSLTGKNKPMR